MSRYVFHCSQRSLKRHFALQQCRSQTGGVKTVFPLHLSQTGDLKKPGGGCGIVRTDILHETGDIMLLSFL